MKTYREHKEKQDVVLEKFIKEGIRENEKLFTKRKLECIKNNEKCINKIYLLGCRNMEQYYKNDNRKKNKFFLF